MRQVSRNTAFLDYARNVKIVCSEMYNDDGAQRAHLPCRDCGSSDALAEYATHTYCFSCETRKSKSAEQKAQDQITSYKGQQLSHNGQHINLTTRKLASETLKHYDYRVRADGNHAAPYRDKSGKVVALHLRGDRKQFRWQGSPKQALLWGQHLWQSKGRRVIITEGEIDCMSIAQAMGLTWPVVSLPNGATSARAAVSQSLEWLLGFDEVILAFDGDDPGRKATEDVAILLPPGKAKVINWPTGSKDASDVLVSSGADKLRKLTWNAATWRPDGIVSSEDLWEHVEEFWHRPVSKVPLPWQGLTEKTHGLRPKELWVWTAGTGIGKSTAANEVVYRSLQDDPDVTWGIVALEESVGQSVTRYLSLAHNRPLHLDREGVDSEDLRPTFDNLIRNRLHFYDHFGSIACDTLATKIRYLASGLKVDFILLDHLSIAVSAIANEDERKAIDGLVTELRSICEQTGVGIHCVSHLRRTASDRGHEEGDRVRLAHLRGSGSIGQLADLVVALERDKQDSGSLTTVRVLKNRYSGDEGIACRLKYDVDTGRLRDSGIALDDDLNDDEF